MKDMRNKVRQAYNKCASDYLKGRDQFKNQKYLEKLTSLLEPKSKILDIGCGAGIPVDKFLISCGHEITGVDISEEQIKLAMKNVPDGNYVVGDMSEIDFNENSFEAIVSFYAIFHIPRIEHLDLFKKIYKLLKPGGLFLATLGSEDWVGSEEFYGVQMHWSHWGKEKNIELVKQAGFEIILAEIDESGGEHHLVVLGRKK